MTSHIHEPDENQFRQSRLNKLQKIIDMGINPYPTTFHKTHSAQDIHTKYDYLANGQETQDVAVVAGRIHSIRNSGMFIDLQDTSGPIQVFCHKSLLNESLLDLVQLLDLGDFIGVQGLIRRTPRGEITINAQTITVLTKTLLPPPEKYHGLTDIEARYRQRYLDLMSNESSRQTLRNRSIILKSVREYLNQQQFLEVETPMLHPIPGGAAARPFLTHHNALDMQLYLRIAPELYLKRLLVGGLTERVYEINRSFRNEGISTRHNPEFTMLEAYQAYADYQDMMHLAENLVAHVIRTLHGTTKITYDIHILDFTPPWPRMTMLDSVESVTGIDMKDMTFEQALTQVKMLGLDVSKIRNWGQAVEAVFAEKVEPTLIQPTHITELPTDISPLAKVSPQNHRVTERFESFCNTWEIANAFSELNNPLDQRARFEEQVAAGAAGDDEAHKMDHDFLTALEHGMPPAGGLGIGIDRLTMLATNSQSIRDVIAFPTMRPVHGE